MANEKKLTKKEWYAKLLAIPAVKADKGMTAFIEHEVELLNKKNSTEKKPSATALANEKLQTAIVAVMSADRNRLYTVTELTKEVPALNGMTTPKVSYLVNDMVKDGVCVKVVDKRKSYFKLADPAPAIED